MPLPRPDAKSLLIVMFMAVAGCLAVDGVPCGDHVCAPGGACDEATGTCLTPEQVTACQGKAEQDACTVGGAVGTCQNGACFVPFCGDGVRDETEECEGTDLGGADCKTVGFYESAGLACTPHCTFDVSACAGFCGDRMANGSEACDSQTPATESCVGFGYDSGALACNGGCVLDASHCSRGFEVTPIDPGFGAVPPTLLAAWGKSPNDVYVVGYPSVKHWNGSAWSELSPPVNRSLHGVWGIGTDVWFVGGTESDPSPPGFPGYGLSLRWNGSTWSQPSTGVTEILHGVWGTSASNVYAVGDKGTIVHWTGSAWSVMTSRTTAHLHAIWGTGASDIYAVGAGGTIDHWNGSQWTAITVGTEELYAITGSSANDIFAVGTNGALLHFTNNAWTTVASFTTSNLYGAWSIGPSDIVSVAVDGGMYRYNNGATTAIETGTSQWLHGVWASDVDNIYVVGANGTLLRVQISAWARVATGVTSMFAGIWGSSATDVVVVGDAILRWNGSSFKTETCAGMTRLWAVSGINANDVVAVGNGGICRWNGSSWQPTLLDPNFRLEGVWARAANDIYAVGDASGPGTAQVLHWTGASWTNQTAAAAMLEFPMGVWGSGPNDVYVVGNINTGGGIVVHYNGSSWTTALTDLTPGFQYRAVWGSGPNDVFVGGWHDTIAHWNGVAWTTVYSDGSGYDIDAIWGTGPSDVFAAGDGKILHWNGSSWSPMQRNTSSAISGIWGTGREIFMSGFSSTVLHRVRECDAAETRCDDHQDDDCDGLIDCGDPDCSASCTSGGQCAGYATLACNTTIGGATAGGSSHLDTNGCDTWSRTGRERVYRVQAPAGGTVTATLTGLSHDVDLLAFAEGAGGACDPYAPGCLAASAQKGIADENVSFAATAGSTYYLVVDGYGGTSSAFTLSVSCP